MATAAFRSTTRRTSIGGAGSGDRSSSSLHRRSRSVSRFSHRIPPEDAEKVVPSENRRGKFVNTMRGSGVPEISLDDLAIELFSSSDFGERGRTPEVKDTAESRRRGRSVSKRGARASDSRNSVDRSGVSDASSRRRRSLSVVRREISDSENEHFLKPRSQVNHSDWNIGGKQKASAQKPTVSSQQRGLRRCSSQKDFLRPTDGYSSYSSTLTDDEGNELGCYSGIGIQKTRQATNAKNKTMAKNHLAGMASDHGLNPAESDVLKAVSTIRKNYKTKLEQSEKRKQELLAEIMFEEERGKELKKAVVELLPNPTQTPSRRPMRGRKRSNDRNRLSEQLVEEADKIIEDFISSVEETDISSFDGERSDTSSLFGGSIKPMTQYADVETFKSPVRYDSLPEEMDGVVLPWLEWETNYDGTPILSNDNKQQPATPKTALHDAPEGSSAAQQDQERSVNSKSSHGSWSPGVVNSFSMDTSENGIAGEVESRKTQLLSLVPRRPRVDIHDYLKPPSVEEFVTERWRQRESINSGGLLICGGGCSGKFCL